jgi:hypothetical protein
MRLGADRSSAPQSCGPGRVRRPRRERSGPGRAGRAGGDQPEDGVGGGRLLHHLGAERCCSARVDHVVGGLRRGCARPEDDGSAPQIAVDDGLAPGQPVASNRRPASSHTSAWRPQPADGQVYQRRQPTPVHPRTSKRPPGCILYPSPHQQEAYQAGRPGDGGHTTPCSPSGMRSWTAVQAP